MYTLTRRLSVNNVRAKVKFCYLFLNTWREWGFYNAVKINVIFLRMGIKAEEINILCIISGSAVQFRSVRHVRN